MADPVRNLIADLDPLGRRLTLSDHERAEMQRVLGDVVAQLHVARAMLAAGGAASARQIATVIGRWVPEGSTPSPGHEELAATIRSAAGVVRTGADQLDATGSAAVEIATIDALIPRLQARSASLDPSRPAELTPEAERKVGEAERRRSASLPTEGFWAKVLDLFPENADLERILFWLKVAAVVVPGGIVLVGGAYVIGKLTGFWRTVREV
jgi:hypothetical protein